MQILINEFFSLLLHDKGGLSRNKNVTEFCESLYKEGNRSPFLLALIVDMCSERAVENGGGDANNIYSVSRAKELCNDLATQYDNIRAKYWVSIFIEFIALFHLKLIFSESYCGDHRKTIKRRAGGRTEFKHKLS